MTDDKIAAVERRKRRVEDEEALAATAPTDENGCYTAPDGSCVSSGPCIHSPAPAAPVIPRLNIRCETTNGHAIGSTYLNVIRVEAEDDGSFTAVTDHWPVVSAASASEDLQTDKRRLDGLRELCGYVENGSETSVTISQDDATRGWIISAGKRWWHGESLRAALDAALGDARHD